MRHVIDEVIQGQLTTVIMQTAHREVATSLLDYYAVQPKLEQFLQSGVDGGPAAPSWLPASTVEAMRSLEAKIRSHGEHTGPQDYPGPWFGIVHGDLHGGNIMVDSRSYAWLIDYGEVEDSHVFKDPAKLEACVWFIYTTLPIATSALRDASPAEWFVKRRSCCLSSYMPSAPRPASHAAMSGLVI